MRYASPPPTRNTPRREGTGPVQNKATREGAVPSLVATGITKQLLLLFGSAPFEGILGQTLQILGKSRSPQLGATRKRLRVDARDGVRQADHNKVLAVLKRPLPYCPSPLGNLDLCEGLATGKRKGADVAQTVREVDLFKLRAVPEA